MSVSETSGSGASGVGEKGCKSRIRRSLKVPGFRLPMHLQADRL